MTDDGSNQLRITVSRLVKEVKELAPAIIETTRASDERARLQKANWTERHRLHVLLEFAQKAERSLPKSVTNPWLLAELVATVGVIRRWHDKPIWKEIEPALVNPKHFTHTIAKLHLAEHLQQLGHTVRIVPKGKDASPDLTVQVLGAGDFFNIECYQPTKLVDRSEVSLKELEKIVDHSMEKAKRQLKETTPGILAIGGFNQPNTTQLTLKQIAAKRLQQTDRPNLCGILTIFFSILYKSGKEGRTLTPMISIDFVSNPSYFGRVTISEDKPSGHPRLIKEPLTYISAEDLLLETPRRPLMGESDTPKSVPAVNIKKERLKIIPEPTYMSRAIIYSKDTLPLFKGEGNINCLCGQCGTILAERAWKLSLSNIVIRCPSCQSFNEFPRLEQIKLPIYGSVGLAKGHYNFTEAVILKRGACLVGLSQ